jgi:hypothetical protein
MSEQMTDIVEALWRDGIASPGWRVSDDALARIVSHLAAAPVYGAHVWAKSDRVPRRLDNAMEVACSTQETVLTAPGFLELADRFTPVAGAYFNEPALLYSVNAFWTAPGAAPPDDYIQDWHRDDDDRKFLVLFIYGSDVMEPGDGTHVYALRTRRGMMGEGAVSKRPDASHRIAEVSGRAGTLFLADTSGLHYGRKPVTGRRLILWARWGVSDPPPIYDVDELTPIDRAKVPYPYADHLRLVMR